MYSVARVAHCLKSFQFRLTVRCTYCLSNSVRVRFAPSPTGNLHLGGLRTALLNYLFAKKNGGKFILRIEDTDRKRVKPGSIENIQNMLSWSGIKPDEGPDAGGPRGPYIQSQRIKEYKEKAKELLERGAAYRCFCSESRLEILRKEAIKNRQNPGYDNKCRHLSSSEIEDLLHKGQPYTIRFKITAGPMSFNDLIFGSHTFDISEYEGDFIILKSDGYPTYHFSCIVDDHLMGITHVLRGAEWLTSTAKHLMLHRAFGWEPPAFAHLPLLVNTDRTKLSKRQESLGVEYFKEKGYEPLALLNFLFGIGTALQSGCEVLDLNELCTRFDISHIGTSSCAIDLKKLDVYNDVWLAKQLSSEMSTDALVVKFRSMLKENLGERYGAEKQCLPDSYIKRIFHCYKGRITTLSELIQPELQYLWTFPDKQSIQKNLHEQGISEVYSVEILKKVIKCVETVPEPEYEKQNLTSVLRKCLKQDKETYVLTMKMLRIVLTGQKDGPGVGEILSMLGRERSFEKLRVSVKFIEEICNEKNCIPSTVHSS